MEKKFQSRWRNENSEDIKKYQKKYRQNNKDKVREYNKKYIEDNREELRLKRIQYKEKRYATKKEWRQNNPLKVKEYQHRRRTFASDLNVGTVQMVYEDNIKKYGTLTCYLCLKPVNFKEDALEHKTPLSRGGTNDYNNLAVSHRSCNCKKHDKTYEEYIAQNKEV